MNEKTIQENNSQTEKSFLQEFDDHLRRESVMMISQCSAWYILVTSKLSTSLRFPFISYNLPYSSSYCHCLRLNSTLSLISEFFTLFYFAIFMISFVSLHFYIPHSCYYFVLSYHYSMSSTCFITTDCNSTILLISIITPYLPSIPH